MEREVTKGEKTEREVMEEERNEVCSRRSYEKKWQKRERKITVEIDE